MKNTYKRTIAALFFLATTQAALAEYTGPNNGCFTGQVDRSDGQSAFITGKTAAKCVARMTASINAHGGIITQECVRNYKAHCGSDQLISGSAVLNGSVLQRKKGVTAKGVLARPAAKK